MMPESAADSNAAICGIRLGIIYPLTAEVISTNICEGDEDNGFLDFYDGLKLFNTGTYDYFRKSIFKTSTKDY